MGSLTTFVDTSALYALMDAADPMHQRAGQTFRSIRDQDVVTSNYVLLEASALVDRRLPRSGP